MFGRGNKSGWRIDCGTFDATLSGEELDEFIRWLQETGRLAVIEAARQKGMDTTSLTCSALATWLASRRKKS